jgi:hypothetical protein
MLPTKIGITENTKVEPGHFSFLYLLFGQQTAMLEAAMDLHLVPTRFPEVGSSTRCHYSFPTIKMSSVFLQQSTDVN